jgi:hypothetical protein
LTSDSARDSLNTRDYGRKRKNLELLNGHKNGIVRELDARSEDEVTDAVKLPGAP